MSKEDLAKYDDTRRKRYPDTYMNFSPSEEATRDHDEYDRRMKEATKSTNKYFEEYRNVAPEQKWVKKRAKDAEPKLETLSDRQHKRLVGPAADAATDTLS